MNSALLFALILLAASVASAHAQTDSITRKQYQVAPKATLVPGAAPRQLQTVLPATAFTRKVTCPTKVIVMSLDDGQWHGSKSDHTPLSHVYTEERSNRQILYCYYKAGGLLTQEVPVGTCQPTTGAQQKNLFLCKP
jgi:hypothetical protein